MNKDKRGEGKEVLVPLIFPLEYGIWALTRCDGKLYTVRRKTKRHGLQGEYLFTLPLQAFF